jgi:hypothetical protein
MTSARFYLRVDPDWAVIDSARDFVSAVVAAKLADREVASQVGIAVHELMENAIKYSSDATAPVQVALRIDGRVQLRVENPIRVEDVPRLVAEISAADRAEDPLAFYHSKMLESITRSDGKSGLGLARIRFESQMSLSCTVDDGVARVSCISGALLDTV